MHYYKELAVLALASTVVARALPDDDVDEDYKAPEKPKGPTPTVANPWVVAPVCTPTYEAYICDDEDGKGEYKTTFTIYPTGCPGYVKDPSTVVGGPKSWYNYPVKATANPWDPAPVKPTWTPKPVDPWAPVADPWVEWGCTKEEYDWWVAEGKKGWPGKPGEPWVPGKDGKPGMPPKPAVPSGWGDWNKWVAPKPTDPAKWNDWTPYTKVDGKTVVIITKTETYYVPCSTGWSTMSTVWYTEHCGCPATPVPVKPAYTTLTTECPTTWGLGPTVVYSTPVCTYTPGVPVAPAMPTTWVTTNVPVMAATTWVGTPVNAASTWVAVSPAAATGTWSPVGVWKGAAASNSVSSLMVMGAGAIAGLAYLL